jgi:hypothetical protein
MPTIVAPANTVNPTDTVSPDTTTQTVPSYPLKVKSLDQIVMPEVTKKSLNLRKYLKFVKQNYRTYGIAEKFQYTSEYEDAPNPFVQQFWDNSFVDNDESLKPFINTGAGPGRFVSAEIEISNVSGDSDVNWSRIAAVCSNIKTDGSVSDEGLEVCTMPAKGLAFVKIMRVLEKSMKKAGCRADSSCGLHVHVDARDLESDDIFKLATLWAKISEDLRTLVPNRRANSTYSTWANFAPILSKRHLKNKTAYETINRVKRLLGICGRYYALNFDSFYNHKTIEFRVHEGTTDTYLIKNWAILMSAIVEYAKNNKLSTVRNSTFADVINSMPSPNKADMVEYFEKRAKRVEELNTNDELDPEDVDDDCDY